MPVVSTYMAITDDNFELRVLLNCL